MKPFCKLLHKEWEEGRGGPSLRKHRGTGLFIHCERFYSCELVPSSQINLVANSLAANPAPMGGRI
jgi:hypothetical protein